MKNYRVTEFLGDDLFEEAVSEAAAGYPAVKHQSVLFDALLAKVATYPEQVQVHIGEEKIGHGLRLAVLDCLAQGQA
ncbi:MAG TPA: hypothetical protein DD417_10200 [Elusimicrobia bacterium]|nr:MAG: hypothetical protein A2X37_04925 [Elusimicrobia bacterium GWA2_66_18]OGR76897.1 MAG: hypothetical protein A2X40_03860 [Elusimicrobia bacterium GWC2_65_9]HBL17094.1 hypothetical protein [Elusimicrobiota bacterium]